MNKLNKRVKKKITELAEEFQRRFVEIIAEDVAGRILKHFNKKEPNGRTK